MDAVGEQLGSGHELLDVGGLRIQIDHSLKTCRHMYYGIYEEHLVRWIARTIRPGDVVIEPGANIGYITGRLLASVRGSGLIVSLEPSRRCVDQLSRNNDLQSLPNLRLLNAAVSNQSGNDIFWETSSIISAGYGYLQPANWNNSTAGISYTIPTHTIDELMIRYGVSRRA